jgi:D-alanine-D-alanine ligase
MRIGLTYDLKDVYLARGFSEDEVAEFESAETVEGLLGTLSALGHDPVDIGHIQNLNERLAAGERWDLVFNIAEGVRGVGRESQVPALLEAYEIPYTFSDALTLAVCLHKGISKQLVRGAGLPTPDFVVVARPADLDRVYMPFPLFVKPVAEGSSKGVTGVSLVHDRTGLATSCRLLLERYRQPVLVEEFLPGREFTVGITGTGRRAKPLGVMEVHLHHGPDTAAYSRDNKIFYESRVSYSLVEGEKRDEAVHVALEAWRTLGCRDAGRVDLRCDARGAVHFLEVNPLAGLHPIHSDIVILCRLQGIAYQDLIARILALAVERQQQDEMVRLTTSAKATAVKKPDTT